MKVWLVPLLATVVFAKNEEYVGWKSYYVEPANHEQLKALSILSEKFDLDFWSDAVVGREGLVLVKPQHLEVVEEFQKFGIKYRIHAEDLKAFILSRHSIRALHAFGRVNVKSAYLLSHGIKYIYSPSLKCSLGQFDLEEQLFKNRKSTGTKRITSKLSYDEYPELRTVLNYMDEIAAEHPDIARVVVPRNSFHNHQLKYMKISKDNFQGNKPIIFIDGGEHGREWLTIQPVTYIINQLVENPSADSNDLLEKFDWIVYPVMNPDSYRYSRDYSAAWQKTVSTDNNFLSIVCPGADPNRNYDVVWNAIRPNDNPCSDIYPGNRTFSEIETRVLRDILHENVDRMIMYISISSFGSLIVYPWAHDGTLSNHAFALHTVGITMADAIKRHTVPHFLDYTVGNSALVRLFTQSGTSPDYAHKIGVPLTYQIELPGLFGGYFMNPMYIEQVSIETWEGIKAGVRRAGELYGY